MAKTSKKTKAKHQDFQKVKLKVGRRLPKGDNVTNASFKSRSIQIKEQLKTHDSSQPTTKRKLNLNDLLSHCQHYNTSIRHDALKGLRELLSAHPQVLHSQLSAVLGRLSELFLDKDPAIRGSVHKLLKFVFPQISAPQIAPFFPMLSAHLCCAMTHIQDEIQVDSLTVLDLCLEHFPSLVTTNTSQLLPNFVEQISRRSQTGKSGSSGSAERSLLVNPGSRISSHKWRIKVLERLHKFLLALQNETRDDSSMSKDVEDTAQSRVVYYKAGEPLNVVPLGSCAVGSFSSLGFKLSSTSDKISSITKQGGGSHDLLGDSDRLKTFIQTLVPLLLDCWVEVGPSQLATNLPENALSSEGLSMLSNVLGVLLLLLQYMDSVDTDPDRTGVKWIQDKYRQDFIHHFMVHFPFSMHEPLKEKKQKGSAVKSGHSEVSVLSLNLAVCEVLSYFAVDTSGQLLPSWWFSDLVSYITQTLSETKLSNEQMSGTLRILEKLVGFNLDEEVLEGILDATLGAIQSRHPNSADSRHLVKFFADLVVDSSRENFLRFSAVSRLLQKLPEMLAQVVETSSGQSGVTTSFLLKVTNRVVPCGHVPMMTSLQQHLPVIIKRMGSLTITEQRAVVELLYRSPRVDEQLLRDLSSVCQQHSVEVATVQYVVQVLHARYLKGDGLSITETDLCHLNFMLSLVIGCSRAELNQLSEKHGSQNDYFKLVVGAKSVEEYITARQKSHCAAQTLKEFPNTSQVWMVLQSFITMLLSNLKVLPLGSAISLLETSCEVCESNFAVDSKALTLLARLVVAVDTFVAMETKEQATASLLHDHMMLQKHEACLRSLQNLPGLSQHVVTAIQEIVSTGGSSVDSARPYVVMLTEYLGSQTLKPRLQPSKPGLVTMMHALAVRFDELEACEWWHSFKYMVSLL